MKSYKLKKEINLWIYLNSNNRNHTKLNIDTEITIIDLNNTELSQCFINNNTILPFIINKEDKKELIENSIEIALNISNLNKFKIEIIKEIKEPKKIKEYKNINTLLLNKSKKLLKEYLNQENIIANRNELIDYFEEFVNCIKLDKNKQENIKIINDFLTKDFPILVKKNSIPLNQEPFIYLDDLEKKTFNNNFNYSYYIKDKSETAEEKLEMVEAKLSDSIDILNIADLFLNFKFMQACQKIRSLDTIVRESLEDKLYDWKNDYQSHFNDKDYLAYESKKLSEYQNILLNEKLKKEIDIKFETKNEKIKI